MLLPDTHGNTQLHPGVVSSVDTHFFVDHQEPLKALERVKQQGQWRLGDLLDGHEFLAIFSVRGTSE